MPNQSTDVAILGAGPNGLSLAAHLRAAGVETVVLGQPLDTWANHMPHGMLLKSEPFGSDIAAPTPGHHIRDFCLAAGIAYQDWGKPVSRETFVAYGDWYRQHYPDDVVTSLAKSVMPYRAGYRVVTETDEVFFAERVVVATGLMPFAYTPEPLVGLGPELVTHVWEHSDLSGFSGQRVGVVGAGQSALETAALMHEARVDVEVIARGPRLVWNAPSPERSRPLAGLRRPGTALCEGWGCWCYYNLGDVFRHFPAHIRVQQAYRNTFGPSGSSWLRERVEGRFTVHTGTHLLGATAGRSKVRLAVESADDGRRELCYDRVIAATGYRMDLARLDFLPADLLNDMSTVGGAPVLSRSFESTVPGIFFVGAMAAGSFGPNMRFLSGSHFMARRLARHLRPRHKGTVRLELAPDQEPTPKAALARDLEEAI